MTTTKTMVIETKHVYNAVGADSAPFLDFVVYLSHPVKRCGTSTTNVLWPMAHSDHRQYVCCLMWSRSYTICTPCRRLVRRCSPFWKFAVMIIEHISTMISRFFVQCTGLFRIHLILLSVVPDLHYTLSISMTVELAIFTMFVFVHSSSNDHIFMGYPIFLTAYQSTV